MARLLATRRSPRAMRGFALVALLIAVALIGLASVATATVSSLVRRREAEEQLLYVGDQYRRAIEAYAAATPAGQPQYPMQWADLLKDPRYPGVRRYLRTLYADPVTGLADWEPIPSPAGGLMGLHSASTRAPIKIDRFEVPYQAFAQRTSYAQWTFCSPDCVALVK